MYACRAYTMLLLNRVQRIGGQAITGSFRTVATAIAEAEACISTVSERYTKRATKFWMNLRTLLETHLILRLRTKAF
jgi:hypothetical protein